MAEEEELKLPKLRFMQICPIDFGECKKKEEIEKEFNPSQIFLDIPYSGYNKKYVEVIRKAIDSFGLSSVLAETKVPDEQLLCNVCETIQKSGYAAVDISGYNPNALFELGLLRNVGKKCCILFDSRTKIPVDLAGMTLHKYRDEREITKLVSKWIRDNVEDITIKTAKQKRIFDVIFYKLDKGNLEEINDRVDEIKQIGDISSLIREYNFLIDRLSGFLEDKDIAVRRRTIEVLGEIGDVKVVRPLITALKDEDSSIRMSAAYYLVDIGNVAVEPLIVALKSKDTYVRRWAAYTLGKIGDVRAIEPLSTLLKDYFVGETAKEAIVNIKSTQVGNRKE